MPTFNYSAFCSTTGFGFDCCDRQSDLLPLIVNCVGAYSATAPFFTDKKGGRSDWYLMFVTSGELRVQLPDGETVTKVGTALIFPPHFNYKYSGSDKDETEYYWVHFTGSAVEKILADFDISPKPAVINSCSISRVKRLFGKLFDGFYPRDNAMPHRLAATLYELLVLVGGCTKTAQSTETNSLNTSIRYMNESLSERISVPELAKMENLSVSRYNTVFRQVTHTSPVRYLLNLRINAACDLLVSTDLSIGEIAESVGFSDARFFSKTFKKTVGLTPSQYRESPESRNGGA